MRALHLMASAITLSAIIGCSGLEVYNDFDHSADFDRYQTYGWLPRDKAEGVIPLYDKRIRTAVDQELAGKGLRKVEEGAVDLIVSYEAALEERIQMRAESYYWPSYTPEPDRYQQGTLVVDLVDYSQNQLVWRGWTSGIFEEDPQKANKQLRKSIEKIFKKYPPAK